MHPLEQKFSLGETRKLVADLFAHSRIIYWFDFLASIFIGWLGFYTVEQLPLWSALQICAFFVSTFALFRATLFIHEISHFRAGDVPGFKIVWNIICGIPLGYPSFLYEGVHTDHHKGPIYGSEEDGEYLPWGVSPFYKAVLYVLQSLYLPFMTMLRFAVLTPISFLHPNLRLLVLERASSLAVNFEPKRAPPVGKAKRDMLLQEFGCFFIIWIYVALFHYGIFTRVTFVHWYFMSVILLFTNSVRTVVAHRYRNARGSMSFFEQMLDSVNVPGFAPITELWAPVGLRFHGLHHLFPNMPYHNYAKAHARLLEKLPADSPYHLTVEASLSSALLTLWKNSKEAKKSSSPISAS